MLRPLLAAASLLMFPAVHAQSLLIENVTVLSPEKARPLGNRHVLIRDGRIVAVSPTAVAAADVPHLDGSGKFLAPGLTDAHVHVSQAIGLPFPFDDPAVNELSKQFFAQQPRSYLYFGVTQVLDPSNWPERVAEFAAQKQHPDIYRCGAAPVVDGYPLVFVDPAIRHQIFKLHLRAGECRRAPAAGRRRARGTYPRGGGGAHRRERSGLREDLPGGRLR